MWNYIKNTEIFGCFKELLIIIPINLFSLIIRTVRHEKMYLVLLSLGLWE